MCVFIHACMWKEHWLTCEMGPFNPRGFGGYLAHMALTGHNTPPYSAPYPKVSSKWGEVPRGAISGGKAQ